MDPLDQKNAMLESYDTTIEQLIGIWEKIGLDRASIVDRLDVLEQESKERYGRLISEADAESDQLTDDIENFLEKLNDLQTKLRIVIPKTIDAKLPLFEIRDQMRMLIDKYSKKLNDIKALTKSLNDDYNKLCKSLSWPIQRQLAEVSTDEEIAEFRNMVKALEDEVLQREDRYSMLLFELREMVTELGFVPSLDTQKQILENKTFDITNEGLENLEKFHKMITETLNSTKEQISECREKVGNLWEILEEDVTFRSQFVNKCRENSLQTLDALKAEIKRCEKKKRQNMKVFVDKIRDEIKERWDQCRYGLKQRLEFDDLNCDVYTEDLLFLHELYLEKLKKYFTDNDTIFNLLSEREHLWEKKEELEEKSTYPDRFKNRGGQLLREEKERKNVDKKLPKIEQTILELAKQYMQNHGKEILIYDKPIKVVIDSDWERFQNIKAEKMSAKKTARDKTPGRTTPGVMTPGPSMMLSHAASDKKSTVKRKLYPTPSVTNIASSRKKTRGNENMTPVSKMNLRTTPAAKRPIPSTSALSKRLNYRKPTVLKNANEIKSTKVTCNFRRRVSGGGSSFRIKRNSLDQSGVERDTAANSSGDEDEYTAFTANLNSRHDLRSSMMPSLPAILINGKPKSNTPVRPLRRPKAVPENFEMDL